MKSSLDVKKHGSWEKMQVGIIFHIVSRDIISKSHRVSHILRNHFVFKPQTTRNQQFSCIQTETDRLIKVKVHQKDNYISWIIREGTFCEKNKLLNKTRYYYSNAFLKKTYDPILHSSFHRNRFGPSQRRTTKLGC